ncbi:MAG: FGGY family carbohydrate kinase [Alphaproteobacteria bacterium]
MSYVIGIDGGTESIRAFVFDLDGRPLASAATPYKTDFPQPSWAEQDPLDWWRCMGQSVRAALSAARVAPSDILALCVDTTCCSVVALDAAGAPLRPCMIWMDVRSAAEADELAATRDPFLRVNGGGAGPVSAEWMIPKALWIKRHQPEVFARAAKIGEYQDYINLRLTGRWVGWDVNRDGARIAPRIASAHHRLAHPRRAAPAACGAYACTASPLIETDPARRCRERRPCQPEHAGDHTPGPRFGRFCARRHRTRLRVDI